MLQFLFNLRQIVIGEMQRLSVVKRFDILKYPFPHRPVSLKSLVITTFDLN